MKATVPRCAGGYIHSQQSRGNRPQNTPRRTPIDLHCRNDYVEAQRQRSLSAKTTTVVRTQGAAKQENGQSGASPPPFYKLKKRTDARPIARRLQGSPGARLLQRGTPPPLESEAKARQIKIKEHQPPKRCVRMNKNQAEALNSGREDDRSTGAGSQQAAHPTEKNKTKRRNEGGEREKGERGTTTKNADRRRDHKGREGRRGYTQGA